MAHPGARFDYVKRTIESLRGLLGGISVDAKLNDQEIAGLRSWMECHPDLHRRQPFCDLMNMLERALEDQVIDSDEREEILDWALDFSDPYSTPMEWVKQKIQNLHGFLHGLAIDDKISNEEIHGLKEWLDDHETLRDNWPFCDVWEIVNKILADGVIIRQESQGLLEYCKNFAEVPVESITYHGLDDQERFLDFVPILRPISYLFDEVEVCLNEKKVCMTGLFNLGSRKQMSKMIEQAGAIPMNNVVLSLDFLVIGSQSSPLWAFSTYGRKVEKALEYKRIGKSIAIISEDALIRSLDTSIL